MASVNGASISGDTGTSSVLQLMTSLLPVFMGSGNKTTTETSKSTVDPAVMKQLQDIISTSTNNANDPAQTDAMVQDIIRKAGIAFAPNLASEARSGLYNSSVISKLASESQAAATGAASQAVLGYKTNQQQIASSAAANLAALTKSTSATSVSKQAPTVPTGISSLLGIGMLGKSIYANKSDILDKLGFGGSSDASGAVTSSAADSIASSLPSNVDFGNVNSIINMPAFSDPASMGLGTSNVVDGGGGSDILSLFGNGGGGADPTVLDAVSGITDAASTAGDAVDAGTSFGDMFTNIFKSLF